jgi:hypothetical protein
MRTPRERVVPAAGSYQAGSRPQRWVAEIRMRRE